MNCVFARMQYSSVFDVVFYFYLQHTNNSINAYSSRTRWSSTFDWQISGGIASNIIFFNSYAFLLFCVSM